MWKVLSRTRKLFPYLFLAIALKGSGAIVELFIPRTLSSIIDLGIQCRDTEYITHAAIFMLFLSLLSCLLNAVAHLVSAYYSQRVGHILRTDLFAKIERLRMQDVEAFSVQSLTMRETNDIDFISRTLDLLTRPMVRCPIMIAGGIVLSFMTNAPLTLIIILGMVLVAISSIMIGILVRPHFRSIQRATDDLTRIMREDIEGIKLIKGLHMNGYEECRFDKKSQEIKDSETKAGTIFSSLSPLVIVWTNITLAVFLLFAWKASSRGEITIGEISAIVQYITLILGSTRIIPRLFSMLSRANISAERVFAVINFPREDSPGVLHALFPSSPLLEVRNLSFTYPGSTHPALQGLSFSLDKGKKLGIIGSTGSGKTTLARLILRLYSGYEGSMKLHALEIKGTEKAILRHAISASMQNPTIFKGTIKENIILDRAYDDERFEKAVHTAMLSRLLAKRKEGKDFLLSENGTNISGGQKQRINVARSLYHECELLILDDISACLDYSTDKEMRTRIASSYQETAIIIISQRVSSVKDADEIIVLDEGRIVAKGNHASLLSGNPLYAHMCAVQDVGGLK